VAHGQSDLWEVRLSVGGGGFAPGVNNALSFAHYMERDLPLVCKSNAVAVLQGWQESRGARLEVRVALECGKQILCAETGEPIEPVDLFCS
jgi:hypothetical protein